MNRFRFLALLALPSLFFACKSSDCPSKITLVQPGENPPNYEVIIKPDGFSQQAVVRFGQEVAVTRPGLGTDIIATVPAGLRGNVEISVEEGDCVGRKNFVVLDSLPGTYGASLPFIVLPSAPNYTVPSIGNAYTNAQDSLHTFFLEDSLGGNNTLQPFFGFNSREFHFGSNDNLNNNPVSGSWSVNPNAVELIVDRTQKGGVKEVFEGQFIDTYPGAPSNATIFLLLTSKTTGRQLVLYRY